MRLPALLARTPWPAAAAAISAAMLATAHTFQRFGYEPCALCLRQREAYWAALAVALGGLILIRLGRVRPRVVAFLLGCVFLAGTIVAAFHAGVEWKWWPGPTACAGAVGSIEVGDLSALLDGTARVQAPACDEAAWVFLGLSMAGWNAIASAALALVSFVVAFGRKEPA